MSSKVKLSKRIIEALREKCRSVEELKGLVRKELPNLSPDALRKRVSRYLNELEMLGLVEERGDKYCWYTYITDFKDRKDYDARLLHSRKLIPALRWIAGITWPRYVVAPQEEYVSTEDMRILEKCVEDHLRAYPEVWRLLEDFRRMRGEVEREREMFCVSLMEKLRKEFGKEPIVEPSQESRYRSFVGSNIPSLICSHLLYGSPTHLKLEGEKIWFGDSLVAKGGGSIDRSIREFIKHETEDEFNIEAARRIGKIERDAIKIRQGLEQELRKLILGIESGEPLLGGCEICSKTFIPQRRQV